MAPSPGYYTITDVARLARIKPRTLYDWQRRGIIEPSIEVQLGGAKPARGYTYADLTLIRLLRALREDQIDFTSAGTALRHLYARLGPPNSGWADAHVYFIGNQIFAERPDGWAVSSATDGGTIVMEGLFGDVFEELRGLEEGTSFVVPSEYRAIVDINPDVMGGEPVVRGTRIPTSLIARLHHAGRTAGQIAKMYGTLSRNAVESVLSYERYLDSATAAA